jgi:hypothetical protein
MRLDTSALDNHFAAAGNEFSGVLATDTNLPSLEFPEVATCNDVSHPDPSIPLLPRSAGFGTL